MGPRPLPTSTFSFCCPPLYTCREAVLSQLVGLVVVVRCTGEEFSISSSLLNSLLTNTAANLVLATGCIRDVATPSVPLSAGSWCVCEEEMASMLSPFLCRGLGRGALPVLPCLTDSDTELDLPGGEVGEWGGGAGGFVVGGATLFR